MRMNAFVLLFVSLLLPAVACNSKPEAAQTAAPPAQASSPQPAVASTSNTSAAQNVEKPETGSTAAAAKIDVCSLIKSEELQAIQGEAVKETKPSLRASASLRISQCLYMLPTFSKSLSLELTQSDSSKGEGVDLKKIWEEKFSKAEGEKDKGREKEREREKKEGAKGGDRERGEEEESQAERVEGIGEEAFWVGNNVLGALYVFSKNSILRLSLGGPEDEAAKIKKLKVLARKAIERL